jgi:1-aminocyclopropane-1-carboxylate deaminase/D-cysteine desulfhydrase-like pyridoxal-dependent ACC family enzyme
MKGIVETICTKVDGHKRTWDLLRLDRIHPVVSGNKPFKLHFHLRKALDERWKGILTFGGPYSNHIHAASHAARTVGLQSIGIIRGEKRGNLSPTLSDAERQGMRLVFLDRAAYRAAAHSMVEGTEAEGHPGFLVIPEGGFGMMGMEGAGLIRQWIPNGRYDTLLCACGTGTTMAGLAHSAEKGQRVIGVSVLKNPDDLESRLNALLGREKQKVKTETMHGYHFGGYARKDDSLIGFMNRFHEAHGVPTDFVYTAKLLYAMEDLLGKGYFRPDEKVLCIHSGGLQGNRSLPEASLRFG